MNKSQIISPIVALLLAGLVVGLLAAGRNRRGYINASVRAIGNDLIASTNSTRLIHLGTGLRTHLENLLRVRTEIAEVKMGDEAAPVGDGKADARLLLTNAAGHRLIIRLRVDDRPEMFHVLGYTEPR